MKKDRSAKIMELLENHIVCTPAELALQMNCSEMTIRRDLASLEKLNLIHRKHGCAYLTQHSLPSRFQTQLDEQRYEKEAIASAAVRFYVRQHMIISLDTGTTTHAIARFLPDNMQLSVITPNLYTALELSDMENIQTYLLGGVVYAKSKSVIIDTEPADYGRTSDIAFVSTRAFRIPGGAFEHTYPLVETKRRLVANAKKTILLFDHTKCSYNSLCNSVPLNKIHGIITDNKTPEELIRKAVNLKKDVIVVDPETQKVVYHFKS
ncbi:MAG: DeoR/GlpR transcriptional regulator [Eubacterium sp.]|nr:DeoR/GlpR transcriptional regulator [Eubacterium sp.]